jgi:hypothetical protein
VVFDQAPGPERIVVVISEQPLTAAAVGAAAERAPGQPFDRVGDVAVQTRWLSLRKRLPPGPGR